MTINVKHILLVDDNANDIELTLLAFAERRLANQVVVARDGAEALDYLHHRGRFENRDGGNPAVVLLDHMMPKVDGLSVLREVRSDPDLKLTPIVLLTSSDNVSDVVQAYNLGVNAYVVKPVNFVEFVDAIRKVGFFWGIINVAPPLAARTRSPSQPRSGPGGIET